MKKKVYLISIMLVTLIGVAAIFTGLLLSSYQVYQNNQKHQVQTYPMYYVPYSVSKGTVSEYKTCDVSIEYINADDEIIIFDVKKGLIEQGEYYSKGTSIDQYIFDFSGRILEVISEGERDNVKAINYNNRKFVLYIDSTELNFFKYGSEHIINVGNSKCKATVTYIDQLLEESTKDAVKVELTINEDSLLSNDDIFLLLGMTGTICYDSVEQHTTLRCFKSAFSSEDLIKGNLVSVVVKKKATSEFITTYVEIGIVGDSYVQLISEDLEEGDVICV